MRYQYCTCRCECHPGICAKQSRSPRCGECRRMWCTTAAERVAEAKKAALA